MGGCRRRAQARWPPGSVQTGWRLVRTARAFTSRTSRQTSGRARPSPSTTWGRAGGSPEEPSPGGIWPRLLRGRGDAGQSQRLRSEPAKRYVVPIQRRRGREALAREPGKSANRQRPPRHCSDPPDIPGWGSRVINRASGCTAQVQAPYLDGNQQVTAYTRVACPNATQLTVKSRLRAAYPGFNDKTVAANGCLGGSGCVRNLPKGTTYFRLSCPRSQTRRNNQPYYTDITFYPGTNSNATSKSRSRTKTLSPFCAN